MTTILVMELRGFAKIATELAYDMDKIGVTPDRVRSAGIHIINETIDKAKINYPFTKKMHLGGDTWYFTFDEFEEGVRYACILLSILQQLVNENGLFFLKPSLALNIGEPKFEGERFLDDDSIQTYRAADSGRPFHLFVLSKAIKLAKQLPWLKMSHIQDADVDTKQLIEWQDIQLTPESQSIGNVPFSLPTLLLDSEVIYSNSTSEAINHIIKQQERSSSVFAFGGPVPLDTPIYKNYIRSTLALMKKNSQCKWTVLSYLPLNIAVYTYTWVELCRRLSVVYPDRFAFSAFSIPEGQLRPFSYQIFDDSTVHIGLRSFSTHRGTPTMSSAIMFRNKKIASRFKEEFLENWRRIGALNELEWGEIYSKIQGLTKDIKKNSLLLIEELLDE